MVQVSTGGKVTDINSVRDASRRRSQYRQALAAQLRDGLAANRDIDLRDSTTDLAVVVAFADEHVCPAWESLAVRDTRQAHLFVAPADFTSGQLSMVSAFHGMPDVADADCLLDSASTFGQLIQVLRDSDEELRVGIVRAPATIDDSGFAFSYRFANLIDI